MLKRLSAWLSRLSTGRVALAALVIFLVFTALVLPRQASTAEENSVAARSPDLSFYYSAGYLYRLAEAYGQAGRAAFVRTRFTFDVIWPLLYTFTLVTAISWAFGKAFSPGSPWQMANLAPVFGMLFDFLENISTSLVMLRYPQPTPVLDSLASVFTMLKWVTLSTSFVLLLAGGIVALWRRLSPAKKTL